MAAGNNSACASAVENIVPPAVELWYDAGGNLEETQRQITSQATRLTAETVRRLVQVNTELGREGQSRGSITRIKLARERKLDLVDFFA